MSTVALREARPAKTATAAVISAENLSKTFMSTSDEPVHALSDVSFIASQGEILGILGPNGAGKTTLMGVLEGIRRADSGSASIFGHDVNDIGSLPKVRNRMGVAMQHGVLPPLLTVQELFRLHCVLFERPFDADEVIAMVGLEEKRYVRITNLSGGQQQRVSVGLALIGNPDLMLLDEPTASLDPQARHLLWDILQAQRRNRNATILLATHNMEEAERLCDRVLILDHGRILADGSPAKLIREYCPERSVSFITQRGANLQFGGCAVSTQDLEDGQIAVSVESDAVEQLIQNLFARQGADFSVDALRVDRKTLEDVFLQLTGRRIRD